MSDDYGTIPMFDVPQKYKAPKNEADDEVRWRAYKGKRTSCDECIVDIAKGERQYASQPAGHIRTFLGVATFLCNRHAQEQKQKDGD